jgi:hypothetical protein
MKLAALLLLLASLPALADSIPTPPITSIGFSGAIATTVFNFPNTYLHIDNTFPGPCSTNCVVANVQLMPDGSFGKQNSAVLWGGGANIFGGLGKVNLNSQTDILSGIFWGKEAIVAPGPQFPEDWYTVKGTFSENLGSGVGSLNLTSENFIGTTPVPELNSWLMLASGLGGIFGLRRFTGALRP